MRGKTRHRCRRAADRFLPCPDELRGGSLQAAPEDLLAEEKRRQKAREDYLQTQVNELWRTLPKQHKAAGIEDRRYPPEPQENILYFIEKNAPLLEPWQREVVRIVRKISQYFYPQKQTQVMNEGWATFWHYTILNHLYDEGRSAIAS